MGKRTRRTVPLLLLFALLLAALCPAYAVQSGGLSADEYDLEGLESGKYDWETDLQLTEAYEPNVIIIKFKDPSEFPGKEKQYSDAVDKVLGTGFEEIAQRTYLVEMEELSKNPNAVLNRFKNNRFVEYAEPDYIGTLDLVPTDPNYAARGAIFSKYINAEAGWDIATSSSVTVAVVDTGYNGNSDLPAASGYSVYNRSSNLTDLNGHGTQVAGTLGAVGCNGTKSAGVVWNANILPVKVSESSSVSVSNVAPAIIYAADHGARIINLSLSFPSDSATLRNAVDYAYSRGCLLVAAAGNNGTGKVSYPAAYSNVLGVGGTTSGTDRYSLSNYGTGLDVLAGWSWFTTTARDTNCIAGGTSIAAPQVSGLAALVWELAPSLTNAQVMELIRSSTNRPGGGWDAQTGYGTIDMGRTLEAARALGGGAPEANPEPAVPETAQPAPEPAPQPETPPAAEQPDVTPPVITLRGGETVELTEGDTYEEPGYTASDDRDGDMTHLVTVSGTVSTAYAGEYTLTYTVMDQAGNTGTAVRRVVVAPAPVPPASEPAAPTITQIGSNPIILHLGGSPYVEQGAQAFDETDGDLSAFVTTEGSVDATQPGTYQVTYSVTNSAGLSASVSREVRVLAPQETLIRTPYSFSGQGKSGVNQSHSVTAASGGTMSLTVSDLNRVTLAVSVTDGSGAEVFSETFTGGGTREFTVSEGPCSIQTSIVSAKGNGKYAISGEMPGAAAVSFAEEEVPLAAQPATEGPGAFDIVMMSAEILILIGVCAIIVLLAKKRGSEA